MPLTFAEIAGKPSMSDLMDKVQCAVNQRAGDPCDCYCWVSDLTETDAIVRQGNDCFRYPYTVGEDGDVTLGEPVKAVLSWRDAPAGDDAVEMREPAGSSLAFTTDLRGLQFSDAAGGTVQIEICRDGTWKHPKYGDVKVDAELRQRFVENFTGDVLQVGELPLDYDHERGPAPGWITGLHNAEDRLYADVRWTPAGRQKVQDGEYRLFSPEWVPNFIDTETGTEHGPTLKGGAITNKPFFRGMTALTYTEPLTTQPGPGGGHQETPSMATNTPPANQQAPAVTTQQFTELQTALTETQAQLAELRGERQRDQLTRQFSEARYGENKRLRLTPSSVTAHVDAALSSDPAKIAQATITQQFVELGERANLVEDVEATGTDSVTASEEAEIRQMAEESGHKFEDVRETFIRVRNRRAGQ